MPPRRRAKKTLSEEERKKVDAIIKRKVRYLTLAEEHADIVRRQGPDVLSKAYAQASKALNPDNKPATYPAKGTNLEDYYAQFDPALNANAKTPYEHMYISLVAAGLLPMVAALEIAYLSDLGMAEVGRGVTKQILPIYNRQRTAETYPNPMIEPEELPILQPVEEDTILQKLNTKQVNELLANVLSLHQKVLVDSDSEICYKIVDINLSRGSSGIASFEVQLQDCTSAVTLPFEEVREMLLRSSIVVS